MPINLSLDAYTGPFGIEQASHLLRRTTFSFNLEMRERALDQGMTTTIEELLAVNPLPNRPLNYRIEDILIPLGQTWVGTVHIPASSQYRASSLRGWTVEQMLKPVINIREKMVLFWHNHFAISDIGDPHFLFDYSNRLRQFALGNFKDFVKEITIDPSMLRFLNGNQNTERQPNENYARELLELFTIGKGPQVAPGDYTNYTEDDISEIARVLTGWRDTGYRGQLLQQPGSTFLPNRHDTGSKQLSHRFNNAVINDNGENEYADLIDILFLQDEIARYICRKLYRYFVYYEISDDIENTVIAGLAQTFVNNNYEVLPVLRQLISSQHFFDQELVGCQIKNPFEFAISLISTLQLTVPTGLVPRYEFNGRVFLAAALLEMTYYDIPQVAGWKAYYQEPVYYRYWINNVTLGLRSNLVELIMLAGLQTGSGRIKPEFLEFISAFSDPYDPNKLIEDSIHLLFTKPATTEQIDFYKEILIPGLPDFEWTVEYGLYIDDPDNQQLETAILARLAAMYLKMFNAPEFHLQ